MLDIRISPNYVDGSDCICIDVTYTTHCRTRFKEFIAKINEVYGLELSSTTSSTTTAMTVDEYLEIDDHNSIKIHKERNRDAFAGEVHVVCSFLQPDCNADQFIKWCYSSHLSLGMK